MMADPKELQKIVRRLGACRLSEGVETVEAFVRLLATPQGVEFAQNSNFPTLSYLRDHKEDAETYGLLLDRGVVDCNEHTIVACGKTTVRLSTPDPTRAYYVVLMHGARLIGRVSGYAVLRVEIVGYGCREELQKDDTAIILR